MMIFNRNWNERPERLTEANLKNRFQQNGDRIFLFAESGLEDGHAERRQHRQDPENHDEEIFRRNVVPIHPIHDA